MQDSAGSTGSATSPGSSVRGSRPGTGTCSRWSCSSPIVSCLVRAVTASGDTRYYRRRPIVPIDCSIRLQSALTYRVDCRHEPARSPICRRRRRPRPLRPRRGGLQHQPTDAERPDPQTGGGAWRRIFEREGRAVARRSARRADRRARAARAGGGRRNVAAAARGARDPLAGAAEDRRHSDRRALICCPTLCRPRSATCRRRRSRLSRMSPPTVVAGARAQDRRSGDRHRPRRSQVSKPCRCTRSRSCSSSRAEHPLAARNTYRADDVDPETLLLLADGHCLRDQAIALCGRGAGATRRRLRHQRDEPRNAVPPCRRRLRRDARAASRFRELSSGRRRSGCASLQGQGHWAQGRSAVPPRHRPPRRDR